MIDCPLTALWMRPMPPLEPAGRECDARRGPTRWIRRERARTRGRYEGRPAMGRNIGWWRRTQTGRWPTVSLAVVAAVVLVPTACGGDSSVSTSAKPVCKIAFVRSGPPPEGGLSVMNADGSGQRRQLFSSVVGGLGVDPPVWSPEGNRVAFVRQVDGFDRDTHTVYVLNVIDGDRG